MADRVMPWVGPRASMTPCAPPGSCRRPPRQPADRVRTGGRRRGGPARRQRDPADDHRRRLLPRRAAPVRRVLHPQRRAGLRLLVHGGHLRVERLARGQLHRRAQRGRRRPRHRGARRHLRDQPRHGQHRATGRHRQGPRRHRQPDAGEHVPGDGHRAPGRALGTVRPSRARGAARRPRSWSTTRATSTTASGRPTSTSRSATSGCGATPSSATTSTGSTTSRNVAAASVPADDRRGAAQDGGLLLQVELAERTVSARTARPSSRVARSCGRDPRRPALGVRRARPGADGAASRPSACHRVPARRRHLDHPGVGRRDAGLIDGMDFPDIHITDGELRQPGAARRRAASTRVQVSGAGHRARPGRA